MSATGDEKTNSENRRRNRHCKLKKAPIWIEAACALALVFITGTYTYYAGQQLRTMKNTLNLDRPWVGISGSGNFELKMPEGGPLSITMNAQNTGRTPALNLVTVNKLETVGLGGHAPDFEYSKSEASPPVVLFPGSITTIKIDTNRSSAQGNALQHLTTPEVEALQSGAVKIYVYGSIWYDDTHGHSHRTDYCFIYIPDRPFSGANFGTCKAHNYAD